MDVEVNYLAVLLAAVSSMVVGSIWYAPSVFGNTWMKLAKVDPKKQSDAKSMTILMGTTFLLSLLTAYVLAHVIFLANQYFGNSFFQDALSTSLWIWLGFVATRILTHNMFDQRPGKLTLLALANELITLVAMGAIIGWLGV